ncbi:alkaline phosphatase family protein [Sporosarcina sp. Marseille-Q4943]|uniref:alkaline phosphatase family protein n=1 Tax=Sporosarcina sp. Marseille-Q4943 TaxID=2942204 RepID=UPI00208DA6EC|nr:alkaline phosphatase family protein [Sporosarcina sp. Marseille-Q4943]
MRILASIIGVILIAVIIYFWGFTTQTKELEPLVSHSGKKPVVLLLVDSLMDKPLMYTLQTNDVPALKFLIENGYYEPEVIASYPTMSVTIDSTILTGTYADQHQLPGLVWFDQKEGRLVNYGSGKEEVYTQGVKQVIQDGLVNLNEKHLNKEVQTIYEALFETKLSSASINGLVYRGDSVHRLQLPKAGTAFGIIQKDIKVKGPNLLSLGSLSQYDPQNSKHHHAWQKFGFNDQFSNNELIYLINNNSLPSFTLAYFPDLDKKVHKKGHSETEGIIELDKRLQQILNSFSTWEEAITKVTWIIYGDSGQATIKKNRKNAVVDLTSLVSNYQICRLGKPVKADDQICIAVNERMAYIYLLDEEISYEEVASQLRKDPRVGFVSWKDKGMNFVVNAKSNEQFLFYPNGNSKDPYDQQWTVDGDLSILDLSLGQRQNIIYNTYPDALARLNGALHSHKGKFLIVDAKPGYEFKGERTPLHLGGAGHGSLHYDDSISPMIVAGEDSLPKFKRAKDFKGWILEMTK